MSSYTEMKIQTWLMPSKHGKLLFTKDKLTHRLYNLHWSVMDRCTWEMGIWEEEEAERQAEFIVLI